ncbi:MAG: ABC transporter substrate-binding protein [Burkholderiales bacterium]|nr:ABC transporter substrate-binding protein [Burkholderiales bacterium]
MSRTGFAAGLQVAAAVLVALPAALITAVALAASPVEIRDDRGVSVELPAPARRIVALAPHLAEIAFAAGAGSFLVGTSSASDYPQAATRVPVVSGPGRIDFERLLAARPDLVLAWQSGNPPAGIEHLERLGIPLAVTEVRRLEDIPRLVRLVGKAAGTQAAAAAAAQALDAQIDALGAGRASGPALTVFVEIWHQPLLTVNGAHLLSDALRRCGARNVFAAAPQLSFAVSLEQLYRAAPQVIVHNALPGYEAEARWAGAPLPAVRAGRLVALDPEAFHRQGPRFVEVARQVCAELDAIRARAARAQQVREQSVREQPLREQPVRDQPARDQPARTRPVRAQPAGAR